MFGVREMNISIELWGVTFCLIGIMCTLLFTRRQMRYRAQLVTLFALELVQSAADAMAGIFRGQPGELAWACTHVGNFLTFAAAFLLVATFTMYLCARLEEVGAPRRTLWMRAVCVLAVAMCLMAATGAFYSIDDGNVYHRSSLHWVSIAFGIVVNAVNAVRVIRHRRLLGRMALLCLLFYTIAPIVLSSVQIFVYGLNFSVVAGVLGLVLIFLEMQAHSARLLQERTQGMARAQQEAAESRIAAMVSQIQPHFLFNALDSIYHLIGEDPARAQKALDGFSTYLRTNLDSLKRTEPVPIQMELRHVHTYLQLEKMSMEELLRFEFDTPAGGFRVPALSVQTLAENAVKHGVACKQGGGTVVVRTREQRDCFLVSVVDDGVGFEPTAPVGDDCVGLANTRARLEAMCGGRLDITSRPGDGTIAVMRVPKE